MDIDKILLNVLNKTAAKSEYEALEVWKNESAENIKLLQELSGKTLISNSAYKEYDKQAAWGKMESLMEPVATTPAPSSKWPLIAAISLVLLSVLFYFFSQSGDTAVTPDMYRSDSETLAFALADNSKIWLKEGGTRLEVTSDFTSTRRVTLEGEAFFDIAPDKDNPFIIDVFGNDFIKVIGTSFNVINDGNNFDLTVFSGVVELHTIDRVLTLEKGDRATRVKGTITLTKNNDKNKLSWKTKEIVFDNIALNKVFQTLENHYDVNISADTNNFAECIIRTKFTDEDIKQVMSELAQQFGFSFDIKGNNIAVSGLSCN